MWGSGKFWIFQKPWYIVDVEVQFIGNLCSFLVILRRDLVVNSNSQEECLPSLSQGKWGLFKNEDIKHKSHLNQQGV